MTEGIEYSPLGTVDVTFDDKTYHLGRPKFRQWRYFSQELERVRAEASDRLADLMQRATDADTAHEENPTDETKAAVDAAKAEARQLAKTPFYDATSAIVAEMFSQVGDPLPEDRDDWPAWLAADSSLPAKILNHWQTHPKASGAPPPT